LKIDKGGMEEMLEAGDCAYFETEPPTAWAHGEGPLSRAGRDTPVLSFKEDRSRIGLLNFSSTGFEYRPIAAGGSNL
jgi:hypothetical protein